MYTLWQIFNFFLVHCSKNSKCMKLQYTRSDFLNNDKEPEVPSVSKNTSKNIEFLIFFLSSEVVSRKSRIKSRCFVCTGDDFFQNITFYLHERQLFNVVFDDYPCRLPEGTVEAHGQGPAAGPCWGPWKSGWDHPVLMVPLAGRNSAHLTSTTCRTLDCRH